jgi:hypothetical protein
MSVSAAEARQRLQGRTIWLWHYLHADWQWEQSRQWHEERYALAVQWALDIMKENSEFCYYFDTASEFFSAVAKHLGPRMEELKQHVKDGRIRIVSAQVSNPRPTQIGDETYIRNIQLGREYFEQNLPPTDYSLFHSVDIAIGGVQMPQILNLAGFQYYKAWRPHGPMNALGIPHQFIWRGIDGSQILVTRGIYGAGWPADAAPNHPAENWDEAVAWLYNHYFHDQLIVDRSPTDHIWMLQGADDALPFRYHVGDTPMDVQGLVDEWRKREEIPIRWCTPLEYCQAVAAQRARLAVVDGVLDGADVGYNIANSGSHGLWIWRQMNDRRLLRAEWWATAAAAAGFTYPAEQFRKLWVQHCVYQAHAEDFAFVEDWNYLIELARDVAYQANQIEQAALEAIAQAAGGGDHLTRYIFNPHPWEVEADVEVYHPCLVAGVESLQALDEDGKPLVQQQLTEFRHPRYAGSINDERRLIRLTLPPMGYRRITIREMSEPAAKRQNSPADGVVETKDLRLVYRDHALHEVHDKKSGHSDRGGAGDSWPHLSFHVLNDQNWLFKGPEIDRKRFVPQAGEWLEAGPIRWRYRSYGVLGPYQVHVDTIVADQGREVQVAVELDGHWQTPPLTGFVTILTDIDRGGQLTVDTPFAVEPRDPDHDIYAHNVPKDEKLGNLGMFERLLPGVYWGRSWCDWSGDGYGVALLSANGNYYWYKEPEQFGHILVRCIKLTPNSWETFCPVSMTGTGTHHFDYAFRFHDGEWRAANLQRRAQELRHPPLVGRTNYPTTASLPSVHSFLGIDGPALLSAYYSDGEDVIVRLYEHTGNGGEVILKLAWTPKSVQAVDFLHRPMELAASIQPRQVRMTVKPWQILTLRLKRP